MAGVVRAKFIVTSKEDTLTNGATIKLNAVVADVESSPEDEAFFKYTPSGQITLSTVNESAALFVVGKKYYVDFTESFL